MSPAAAPATLAGAPAPQAQAPAPAGALARAARLASGLLLLVALMALVAVAVGMANGLRVRVEQTGSMAPAIAPGDLVLVRQIPATDVRLGDVIGVRNAAGAVIVHRVKAIDGAGGGALRIRTQGDANPTSETWTIRPGADVALVRGTVPAVGEAVDAVKGPAVAIVVLLAGLLLAISTLRRIWSRP